MQQREAILRVYDSAKMTKKLNLMKPDQVAAIYLRLKEAGKI